MESCEEYFGNQLQIWTELINPQHQLKKLNLTWHKNFPQHNIDYWVIWSMGLRFQNDTTLTLFF